MKIKELLVEVSISDIHADLENYKSLSPKEFFNMYGINKQQWYEKNKGVVGPLDQHKTHKGHTYVFYIPGEDPWLNKIERRHFDDELSAQRELRRLQIKYPGTTMKKVN